MIVIPLDSDSSNRILSLMGDNFTDEFNYLLFPGGPLFEVVSSRLVGGSYRVCRVNYESLRYWWLKVSYRSDHVLSHVWMDSWHGDYHRFWYYVWCTGHFTRLTLGELDADFLSSSNWWIQPVVSALASFKVQEYHKLLRLLEMSNVCVSSTRSGGIKFSRFNRNYYFGNLFYDYFSLE